MTDITPEQTIAADMLIGAENIRDHLRELGLINISTDAVYYGRAKRGWPISKHGKTLFASKSKLTRYVRSLIA
jgi:hypothetical protein